MTNFDKENYRGAIMHGYMIHERTQNGYVKVLLSAKAGVLAASWSMIAIAESFPSPIGIKLAITAVAGLLFLAAVLGFDRIEMIYGKPVFRPFRAIGNHFWHWELEMPKRSICNQTAA